MRTEEREGAVTLEGEPVTLLGPGLRAGDDAPEFMAVDKDSNPISLSLFRGRPCLVSVVPSLDTPVCAAQTRRFNEEVNNLPAEVAVLTISMDEPSSQKRFCESEKISRVKVLSDRVWREFGLRYGVLIKEKDILARSVFVIGGDGRIVYQQIVPEISEHPDYNAALDAVRETAEALA